MSRSEVVNKIHKAMEAREREYRYDHFTGREISRYERILRHLTIKQLKELYKAVK